MVSHRHPLRALLITCLLLGFAACARAAENAESPRYAFNTYGVEAGLPASIVNVSLQTRDGYLWVGTQSGLGRFDGVRFTSFHETTPVLSANTVVLCLLEDRDGSLWIGTTKGLIRYRAGAFDLVGMKDVPVRTLAADAAGQVWVGTTGRGLFRWRGEKLESFSNVDLPATSAVRALYGDSRGRLWIAIERGRGVVILEREKLRRYEPGDFGFSEILSICEQPRDTLWFGTQRRQLYQLRGDVLNHFSTSDGAPRGAITDLRPARDGGLWVAAGTLQHVADLEHVRATVVPGLPNDSVRAVHEDREGGVWLSSGVEGLTRMRRIHYRAIDANAGLPGNNVKNVAEDAAGNLWLSIQNQGISRVAPDGTVKRFDEADGIASVDAAVVRPAGDGTVWSGTSSRLFRFRDGQWQRWSELRFIRGLHEDRSGRMWVGTESQGLHRFDGERWTEITQEDGAPIPLATSFAEADDGTFYIGTWRKGVFRIKAGIVTRYHEGSGFPANEVRAMYVDREGRVWAGTSTRGIAVLDGDRWYNPALAGYGGAPCVSAIAEDKQGRLWLGTPSGIGWVAKGDLLANALRGSVSAMHLIATGNDLRDIPVWSGAQPIVWESRNGELLFATRRGVIRIDPASITGNDVVPLVHIERVLIDRQPADSTGEVRIPAGARSVEVQYTAPSFVQSDQVRFKYQLAGYDEEWIDAGSRRTAYFSGLPPGRYTFRVSACNNDGVWNPVGATIVFVQMPHFYQTRWFLALMLALGALLVWGFYVWSHRRLRARLERLEHERAMENERRRIAQDLHDDLGARVTEIGLLTETALQKPPAEAHQEIRELSGRVQQLVGALDTIVWAVNPANDSLDQLVAYLGDLFQELFRRSPIKARLAIADDIPHYLLTTEERSHIFLAAKEAMNNVLKHSGASEAWLRVCMNGEEFSLMLEDNGRGFDQHSPHTAEGNGLANMRSRLGKLNGAIAIRSAPGAGTTVTIAVRFTHRATEPAVRV